jgi:hypothetical protein
MSMAVHFVVSSRPIRDVCARVFYHTLLCARFPGVWMWPDRRKCNANMRTVIRSARRKSRESEGMGRRCRNFRKMGRILAKGAKCRQILGSRGTDGTEGSEGCGRERGGKRIGAHRRCVFEPELVRSCPSEAAAGSMSPSTHAESTHGLLCVTRPARRYAGCRSQPLQAAEHG